MHPIQDALLSLISRKQIGHLTLRDIGVLIDEKDQPQKIKHHVLQLAKRGLIRIDKRHKKIDRVTGATESHTKILSIPIYGAANCGEAVQYADQYAEGYLKLSRKLVASKSPKLFAVRAIGNSMNKARIAGLAINNGDYVLVDATVTRPKNGDYILSTIDGAANIKKFTLNKATKTVALLSESNQHHPPILLHETDLSSYIINGKIVQVIKL